MFRARSLLHEVAFDRMAEAIFGSLEEADDRLSAATLELATSAGDADVGRVVFAEFVAIGIHVEYRVEPTQIVLLSVRLTTLRNAA